MGRPTSRPWHRKRPTSSTPTLSRERPNDPEVDAARRQALLGVADLRRETSRWGETYLALRKSESNAREAARSASAGRPADQSIVATLAQVGYGYGKLALWDEAAAAFSKAYEIDPVGLQTEDGAGDKGFRAWYRVAVLQLQGGQTDAYERLRERMLRENAAGNLESPLDQIRTATLRPDPRSDWRQILELAEKVPERTSLGSDCERVRAPASRKKPGGPGHIQERPRVDQRLACESDCSPPVATNRPCP